MWSLWGQMGLHRDRPRSYHSPHPILYRFICFLSQITYYLFLKDVCFSSWVQDSGLGLREPPNGRGERGEAMLATKHFLWGTPQGCQSQKKWPAHGQVCGPAG